jgi:hypothetical protein
MKPQLHNGLSGGPDFDYERMMNVVRITTCFLYLCFDFFRCQRDTLT